MDVRGLEIVVGDETTVVEVIPTDHDLRQVIVPKAESISGREVSSHY